MTPDEPHNPAATEQQAIDVALSRSGMLSEMETGFVEEQRRSALEPGRVLSRRFEIVRMIGAGGMGAVYEAKDRILADKAMALKVMLPSLIASEQARERFTREAMLTRDLRHPCIVNVYDVGMDEDLLYLTMELVRGESANDWRRKRGGKVDAKNACGFMHKVAEALRYAHENNVIHRDLKPQNILVIHGGQIRLVDFGLARAIGTRGYARTQAALGTPYYMAPEQSRNSPNVDARADIYSLGVILYQLVTGELPMGVFEPPSEVDGRIPTELDDLVNACLQRRPGKRLATAKEVAEWLEKVYWIAAGKTDRGRRSRTPSAGAAEPPKPPLPPPEEIDLAETGLEFADEGGGSSTAATRGARGTSRPAAGETDSPDPAFDFSEEDLGLSVEDTEEPETSPESADAESGVLTDEDMVTPSLDADIDGDLAEIHLDALMDMPPSDRGHGDLDTIDLAPFPDMPLSDDEDTDDDLETIDLDDLDDDDALTEVAVEVTDPEPTGLRLPAPRRSRRPPPAPAPGRGAGDAPTMHRHRRLIAVGLALLVIGLVVWAVAVAYLNRTAQGWPFSPSEANSRQRLAEKGLTVPKGWRMAPRELQVATERGEETLRINYYTNPLGMRFVAVPSGEFLTRRGWSEHRLRIAKPFLMQACEVTQGQWDRAMGANPSRLKGPRRPVESVSWEAAKTFVKSLNAKEGTVGVAYRLPTEAEWEYACRAGSPRRSYADELGRVAWYLDNGGHQTREVGGKLPNAFGLFDTIGNVSEWCYASSPGSTDGRRDPRGDSRVLRGGSWFNNASKCVATYRQTVAPKSEGKAEHGFRLVAVLPPAKGKAPASD